METKEHYPKIKDGPSFDELLEDARKKKIKQGKWNDVYEKRLRHEMKVIKEMGYVDYHLVVRDVFTSVSISGIDTRSGFKKRSKRRLYFTGSIFVIPSR